MNVEDIIVGKFYFVQPTCGKERICVTCEKVRDKPVKALSSNLICAITCQDGTHTTWKSKDFIKEARLYNWKKL